MCSTGSRATSHSVPSAAGVPDLSPVIQGGSEFSTSEGSTTSSSTSTASLPPPETDSSKPKPKKQNSPRYRPDPDGDEDVAHWEDPELYTTSLTRREHPQRRFYHSEHSFYFYSFIGASEEQAKYGGGFSIFKSIRRCLKICQPEKHRGGFACWGLCTSLRMG